VAGVKPVTVHASVVIAVQPDTAVVSELAVALVPYVTVYVGEVTPFNVGADQLRDIEVPLAIPVVTLPHTGVVHAVIAVATPTELVPEEALAITTMS
jgi:hypothetical protein